MVIKSFSKKHPESLDEVKALKPTFELRAFVNDLSKDISEAQSERSKIDEAINRLDRLRYGVRTKKTHPWPNAANYVIPQIDTDINRLKPAYANLVFGVSPVVTFEPYGPEDIDPARKREILFDWRMRTQVQFFKPLMYGLDQILGSPGQTVFRIIWKFSTNKYHVKVDMKDLDENVINALYDPRMTDDVLKQVFIEEFDVDDSFDENIEEIEKAIEKFHAGEQEFDLNLLEIEEDQPEVIPCHIVDDLTVPTDTKDLNDARFIDYKFWIRKNDLKIAIRDGKYDRVDENEIDSWAGQQIIDSKGRTVPVADDMILMHETCCWYDVDNDGIEERCIATWPDAQPEAILRFIELPYDHGMWPYVQVKREFTEPGFYASRGVPSLDEDFQVGISTAVNQAIDNGTLLNAPERVARKNLISNPKNRRFIPGEFVEVNGSPAEYETRVLGNVTQPVLFQQAQYLKSWSDSRLGQISSNLSGQTELPGAGDRGKKTAKEVEAILSLQNEAQSLDLMIFQQQMAMVYYQMDALYEQFGSDEEFIAITGQQPQRISREEIQGKFNIIPNGRLDNSTPAMRLRKSMSLFQIGTQNPFFKQRELYEAVVSDIEPRLAQKVLKTEEEILQEQQQSQVAAIEAENEGIRKQLGLRRMSDDMDVRKEIMLTPIQGRKFAPN